MYIAFTICLVLRLAHIYHVHYKHTHTDTPIHTRVSGQK